MSPEGRWSRLLKDLRHEPPARIAGRLRIMTEDLAAQGVVLVVEADPAERELFSSWLEESGFTVLACPGPTEPDFTCVGDRKGTCPLAEAADVVVLDMSLESEALMRGTAAEDLLGLYLVSGRPVVTLGSRDGDEVPGELTRLRRHPTREALLQGVRGLYAPEPDWRVRGTTPL
jgi:CheY-like chemotaxis protein